MEFETWDCQHQCRQTKKFSFSTYSTWKWRIRTFYLLLQVKTIKTLDISLLKRDLVRMHSNLQLSWVLFLESWIFSPYSHYNWSKYNNDAVPTIENTGLCLSPNSAYALQPAPHSAAFFLFCSRIAELAIKWWGGGRKKKKSSLHRNYEIIVAQQTTKLVNFLKRKLMCTVCLSWEAK